MIQTTNLAIPRKGSDTFDTLLGYENPKLTEHLALAEREIARLLRETRACVGDSFAQHWYRRVDDCFAEQMSFEHMRDGLIAPAKPLLDNFLKNERLLLDLGGRNQTMAIFADFFDVQNLITVDINLGSYQRRWEDNLKNYFTKSFREVELSPPTKTRLMFAQTDMLYFVAQLPSKSCSISMNGLNSWLISADYARALAAEMERVVRPGGVIFGFDSTPLEPERGMITSSDFKRLDTKGTTGADIWVRAQ